MKKTDIKTKALHKQFIGEMNERDKQSQVHWKGKNTSTGRGLGARKRSYGDYLYHQDRDKFNVDFEDWRKEKNL